MARRLLTLLLALVAGAALASCRVDVAVVVQFGADGTGEIVVTATADAEVVAQAPGLADDLRFDDAVDAGWVLEGPTATDDGGLTVVLTHPVTSAAEASNLLASLGPPFTDVALQRVIDPDDPEHVTVELSGQLQLEGGFETFADAELLASVGAAPYTAELTAAAATPAESLSFTLRADLPGEVAETTGDADGGALVWTAPLDGLAQDLATTTEQRPDGDGPGWAGPLSWLALLALVAWLALVGVVGVAVVRARRRRNTRRDRALSRLR